jgi:hypothetical protein
MLPQIAFANPRLPVEIRLFGFENALGNRCDIAASKLHPEPCNELRISIASARNVGNDRHGRLP